MEEVWGEVCEKAHGACVSPPGMPLSPDLQLLTGPEAPRVLST